MMNYLLRSRQQSGLQLSIGESLLTVGRAEDNALCIDNPTVSRHHAILQVEAGALIVVDLGSSAGTFVNDVRVQRTALQPGDVLRFGDSDWQVEAVATKIAVAANAIAPKPATPEPAVVSTPAPFPTFQQVQAALAAAPPQLQPEVDAYPTPASIPLPAVKPRANWQRRIAIGGPLLIIGLLAILFIIGLVAPSDQLMSEAEIPLALSESGPLITLAGLSPDDKVSVGQQASLLVSAYDEQGVQRLELWANGQLVDAYDSTEAGGSDLNQILAWQTNDTGNHDLFVRAYDAEGDVSISNVIPVIAAPDHYEVAPGDTWETIADATGYDLEALQANNPGPVPPVGNDLVLPDVDGTDEYAVQAGESLADIARTLGITPQDLLAENPGLAPNENLSPDTIINIPILENYAGEASESAVELPATGGLLPAVPGFQALSTEKCGDVKFIWGTLAGATGYKISGIKPGTATMLPMEEDGPTAISTVWTLNASGQWVFYIAGVDNSGRDGTLTKATFTAPDCDAAQSTQPAVAIPLQSLDVQTSMAVQQIYAYVRFGGLASRYQRLPQNPNQFLTLGADGHFRTTSLPSLEWQPNAPMPLEVEVWGWAGQELVSLGSLNETIDTVRALKNGSISFSHPAFTATLTFGSNLSALLALAPDTTNPSSPELAPDEKLPPPASITSYLPFGCAFGLALDWELNTALSKFCSKGDNWKDFVAWQWPPSNYFGPANNTHLSGFQFKYQIVDPYRTDFKFVTTDYIDVPSGTVRAWPILIQRRRDALPCGATALIWMRAVGKHNRFSDWTPVVQLNPTRTCETQVAIVFDKLEVFKTNDGYGDNRLETYGYLLVGQHYWPPELCSGKPCSWQPLKTGTYQWGELDKLWRTTAQGEIPVRLSDQELLSISVSIVDWDANSGDDKLCTAQATLASQSLAGWQAFARQKAQFVLSSPNCRITGHIAGQPQPVEASASEGNLGAITASVNGCGSQEGGAIDPPNLWFGDACAKHDACYFSNLSHKTKEQCDDEFLKNMRSSCQRAGGILDAVNACLYAAETYYSAVVLGGHGSYIGDTSVTDCLDSNSPVRCTVGYAGPVIGQAGAGVVAVGKAGVQLGKDGVDVTVKGAKVVGNGIVAGGEAVGNGLKTVWCAGPWC